MKKQNLLLLGAAAVAAYFLFMRKGTGRRSFDNVLPPGESGESFMETPSGSGGGALTQAQDVAETARQTVELAQGTVQTAVQSLQRTPEQRAAAQARRKAAKTKRVQRRATGKATRMQRREAAKARRAARRAKRSMGEINVM